MCCIRVCFCKMQKKRQSGNHWHTTYTTTVCLLVRFRKMKVQTGTLLSLSLESLIHLNSHNDDSSFLFNCRVGGKVGQRMYTHSKAVYRGQVQPIRISNSTHAVFGHRVDCAVSISENDWWFLVRSYQHRKIMTLESPQKTQKNTKKRFSA